MVRKLLLVALIFSISFTFALPSDSDVDLIFDYPINYSEIPTVNQSDFWVTNEGVLDNVGDILHNWLDNLEWSNSGHTIDTDIDMNGNALTNVDSVYFDLTPTSTGSEGELWWSEEDGTLNIGLHNGSVLQTGQEFLFYAKASGSITNGDVIQFVGVQGDHILVKKAVGSEIRTNPEYFLGIATQDIANGNFGYITYLGEVRDFDTGSFQLGDILYFDYSTGGLSNSTPTPPDRIISIAVVTKVETSPAANNGVILARPTVGLSLDDLSDVNNGCPDLYILQKNATSGTWECTSLATTYYNATSSQAVTGTVAGTLSLTQHPSGDYDGVTFNITERVASPALDLRVNFTDGITDFTQGILRYYTGTINGNHPMIQLWDYEDEAWENYGELSESTSFAILQQSVFDSSEHVQNGVVQMRIYKSTTGNINNKYYIDWLAIAKGFGVPAGEEIDPIWNDEKGNYIPYIGATSNINISGYNITADYFFGDGSQLTGIEGFNETWGNQTYVLQNNLTTVNVTTEVCSYYTLWGEESATATAGYKLSWGNGDEAPSQGGAVIPEDSELYALGVTTSAGSGLTFRIYQNASLVATSTTWSGPKYHYENLASPIQFNKGDVMDFYTATTGTGVTAGYRTFAYFRKCENITTEVTGLQGPQGIAGTDGSVDATAGINLTHGSSITPPSGATHIWANSTGIYQTNSTGSVSEIGGGGVSLLSELTIDTDYQSGAYDIKSADGDIVVDSDADGTGSLYLNIPSTGLKQILYATYGNSNIDNINKLGASNWYFGTLSTYTHYVYPYYGGMYFTSNSVSNPFTFTGSYSKFNAPTSGYYPSLKATYNGGSSEVEIGFRSDDTDTARFKTVYADIWIDSYSDTTIGAGSGYIVNITDDTQIWGNLDLYGGTVTEHSYDTNLTDKEAYELVQWASKHYDLRNGEFNYSAWGECYVPEYDEEVIKPMINDTLQQADIALLQDETYWETLTDNYNDDEIELIKEQLYNKTQIAENYLYNSTEIRHYDAGTNLLCKGVMMNKAQAYQASAGKAVELADGTTALDGQTSLWENIYTKSKVISLLDNYALKFLNTTNLDSKDTHKNKETINFSDGTNEDTLNMEDRIVDLEGAFSDHMTCMYLHDKYEDYRDCMLDTNPKEKIK